MHPTRRQLIAYAAVAVVVAAVGVRYLATAGRAATTSVALTAAVASPSPSATASAQASAAALIVYACGAVDKPGVYELPSGARIADLLALAGAGPRADLASINLAARLTDGQQVVVPTKGAAQAAATSPPAAGVEATSSAVGAVSAASPATQAAPVSLNSATLEQLDALQGVGPVTAQKIIDYRTQNGGFKSVDELKNIPGIGEVRFAALKDYVTL
jgi:competence protein ComEA